MELLCNSTATRLILTCPIPSQSLSYGRTSGGKHILDMTEPRLRFTLVEGFVRMALNIQAPLSSHGRIRILTFNDLEQGNEDNLVS